MLSRPINDLRKVLSRDPDHDVHHFFFLSYTEERYLQPAQGFTAEGAKKEKLEQEEEKRE